MKNNPFAYLETVLGNHHFYYNCQIIIAWVVCDNKTICISLDSYEGNWLRAYGKFDDFDADKMAEFLMQYEAVIKKWLPESIAYAAEEKLKKAKLLEELELKRQQRIDKDRRLKLYRCVKLKKRKNEIVILTQPYEVGVYIAIYLSKSAIPIQTSAFSHRSANIKIEKIIKQHPDYKLTFKKETITYPLNK